MATRTTADWQRADAAHFLHPFTDFQALARKGSRIIERADNIYLWDTQGHRILDAMSGLWCVNVGYGQRALIDAATRQLETLPFYNAFFQTATPPAIELAELLAEVTPPQFQHVFFAGSGSEGNDTIVRMVRRYWDLLGQPERQVIISRHHAYHGSTMAGASLGGMSGMHAQGGLPIPGIVHIEQPFWFEHGQAMTRDEFGLRAAAVAAARSEVSTEDIYYRGLLHWIAENYEGTAADLSAYGGIPEADPERAQTARSIAVISYAKLKRLAPAMELIAKYDAAEPVKLGEVARMNSEVAKAFIAQGELEKAVPHAERSYRASKALLSEPSTRVRALDELLDSGMLIFEANRDLGRVKEADDALIDMRAAAASFASPIFYYYSADKLITHMLETGRRDLAFKAFDESVERGRKLSSLIDEAVAPEVGPELELIGGQKTRSLPNWQAKRTCTFIQFIPARRMASAARSLAVLVT